MPKNTKKRRRWNLPSLILYLLFIAGFCAPLYVLWPELDHGLLLIWFVPWTWLLLMLFVVDGLVFALAQFLFLRRHGWRFVYAQFGSFLLVQEQDGLHLRRSFDPSSGFAQMSEPPKDAVAYPALYFYFGVVVLLACGAVCALAAWLLGRAHPLPALLCSISAVTFLYVGLHNLYLVWKDRTAYSPEEMLLSLESLRRRAQYYRGAVFSDVPEEQFALPEDADLSRTACAQQALDRVYFLEEKGAYEEADALVERLLSPGSVANADTAQMRLLRIKLNSLRLRCELLGPCRPERIAQLLTPELHSSLRALSRDLGAIVTLYLLAVLYEPDRALAERQAKNLRREFASFARNAPCRGLVALKSEMMQRADSLRAQRDRLPEQE